MKKTKLLARLGLEKTESIVYLAILELGYAGITDIARQTGLYRPAIYKCLPSLVEKNLVAQSERGKRKVFFAESPKQLQQLVSELNENLQKNLPDLMNVYVTTGTRPIIKFFEGEKGIKHVYEDLVASCKKGDIFYRYESPKNYHDQRKYIPNAYRERFRDKMEVERLIITNDITQKQKKKRLGRLVKIVPPEYDLFVYDITQLIYKDKVAFIDFKTKTASVIESATFAEFQRKIFKLLFDKL